MGQELADLYNRQEHWAHSTPTSYAMGATQDILAITGGIVYITAIIEYCDTAMTAGAVTTAIFIGATGLELAAVAINAGGAGAFVISPLDPAGGIAKLASAVVANAPSLAGMVSSSGLVAAPGVTINVTFAGFNMAAGDLYSLHVKYRKIHPNALIA